MNNQLLGPVFGADLVDAELTDRAWVQAMLDVEATLARSLADVGLMDRGSAETIAAACAAERFDPAELGRRAAASGSPAIPLVRDLTAAVAASGPDGEEAARWVHTGATSQDIVDTALTLLARRALRPIHEDLATIVRACADLAGEHRETVLPGRSFGQHGLPTSFGLKAAGWLVAVGEARERLSEVDRDRLAVQFGGAVGTLASLRGDGTAVLSAMARRLELAEPLVPWHTARVRGGELGSALGITAGGLGKIARDVVLLSQTELGEVAEPAAPGRGTSSTMPHKRNPVGAVTASAAVHRVPGLVSSLLGSMVAEHERPAGQWHAEWEVLTDLLRLTGGAAARIREDCEGLRVSGDRMRADLDSTRGLLMAENVTTVLAPELGRLAAHDLVETLCARAVEEDRPLRAVLLDEPRVTGVLSTAEVDAALDPAGYLGSAGEFIDRALRFAERGTGSA